MTPAVPTLDAWTARVEQFAAADFAAWHLLIQAPWPNATDAIDTDDALQLVARTLPEHARIAEHVRRFTQLLESHPAAADAWNDLHGDLMAYCEEYALLLGVAIGQRLAPHAWQPPAAPKAVTR